MFPIVNVIDMNTYTIKDQWDLIANVNTGQLNIVKMEGHRNVLLKIVHVLDLKLRLVAVVDIHILRTKCIGKPLKRDELPGYYPMKIRLKNEFKI